MLKNGWHRARLVTRSDIFPDNKYMMQETTFRSFTPLNELREQFYVRSYDHDVLVEDFPRPGSDVTLRFDSASQSFVIVSQTVHLACIEEFQNHPQLLPAYLID